MEFIIINVMQIMFTISACFCYEDKNIFDIIASQDASTLLGSDKSTAKIVDVSSGANVQLKCHFRTENDNLKPKLWTYKARGHMNPIKEIVIGKNCDQNKIMISSNHTLKIKNFNTSTDSGVYTCKFPLDADYSKFTYVVEGVYEAVKPVYSGNVKQWQEYKIRELRPINEQFENSNHEPFRTFLNTFRFSFRIKTSWEPWSPCEGLSASLGIRKKIGKCRLQIIPLNYKKISLNSNIENINQFYIKDNYDVPCRATKLNETLPRISKIVRNVPDYEMRERCTIDPIILSEQVNEYKIKCKKQIVENSNCILVCSDAGTESKVEWYKDGKLLNSSYRNNMGSSLEEPHLTIDSYNSLYINHVTKKEEGVYTCTVNDKKVQMYEIKIVAKCRLLNEDFFRYSIYLGFVLSLTITCYCAGICVAWHGKNNFADPFNLNIKKQRYHKLQAEKK